MHEEHITNTVVHPQHVVQPIIHQEHIAEGIIHQQQYVQPFVQTMVQPTMAQSWGTVYSQPGYMTATRPVATMATTYQAAPWSVAPLAPTDLRRAGPYRAPRGRRFGGLI